ncbi:MAG: hypothetical protein A2Y64_01895 [Candidatus Coatesbacteria bacterium RBG_13_66_14]|uniref:Uncharacterized protein n=1 Tax=Candidatus Coatesbacteria bacterium RBG_13_66_14 TaxID=1817816 RepID=A0A1F5F4C2_9BACT|nr:MAG: hypothetical protein A2Y64_01895 [Candidatus Coatesbacteria bacterium RBG_13_66_14]
MTRITILLLVAVTFTAVPVVADDDLEVLWDQGFDYESMIGGWMIYGEYYTQDDFTLETDAEIEVVEFWAYYYPEEPAYHLSFWANVRYDQYGMPGAYYFRDWVGPDDLEEIDTGYDHGGHILYLYRLNIEPCHIEAGTPFWLEIRSEAENCKWGFETGGILYFQWDPWSQETFFRLLGTPDETSVQPASWGEIKAGFSD